MLICSIEHAIPHLIIISIRTYLPPPLPVPVPLLRSHTYLPFASILLRTTHSLTTTPITTTLHTSNGIKFHLHPCITLNQPPRYLLSPSCITISISAVVQVWGVHSSSGYAFPDVAAAVVREMDCEEVWEMTTKV